MKTINQQLEDLYRKFLIEPLDSPPFNDDNLSAPFLIKFTDDSTIADAGLRVMFFGQEPRDWIGKEHTMDEVREKYRNDFDDFSDKPREGPFWRILEEMKNTINERLSDKRVSYVWNNIVKADYEGEKNWKVPDDIYNNFCDINRGLILGEIEIIKPDVLVFFTGPNIYYDKKIDYVFNNGKKIDKKGTEKGVNINTLAEMRLSEYGNSYITYHPLYLGRNAKSKKGIVLSAIAEQCAAVAMSKVK